MSAESECTPKSSKTIPLLRLDELEAGDVLLFRGSYPVSQCIRLVDDGDYDHSAIVAGVHAATREPLMLDVGFFHNIPYALGDYDDPPDAALVRRHRIPGWRGPVVVRAHELHAETVEYSWVRFLLIVIINLTRFSEKLAALELNDARFFSQQVFRLFHRLNRTLDAEPAIRRTCADFVREAFDVEAEGSDPDRPYFGLTLIDEPLGGLAFWAQSGKSVADFVIEHDPRRTADSEPTSSSGSPSFDEVFFLIRDLWESFNASFAAPPDDGEDFDGSKGDARLRAEAVRALRELLERLGITALTVDIDAEQIEVEPPRNPAEMGELRQTAAFLLDHLLRNRVIVTPRDMRLTRSLYDAGQLDVSSVNWRKPRHRPR